MAERRVLADESRSGSVGRRHRKGRSRPIPGSIGQAARNGRDTQREPVGSSTASEDAVQEASPPPPAEAQRSAAVAAETQDQPEGVVGTGRVKASAVVLDIRPDPAPEPEPETGPPCPACDAKKAIPLYRATDRLYGTTTEEFTIVECANCKLIRLEPQPEQSELYKYYPRSYWFAPGDYAAERFEEMYRRVVLGDHVRFVQRALENSGETGPGLDVGCGGGLFLNLMARKGASVLGLDISVEAARVATKVNGVPVLCGWLPYVPLPPESCAVVTMFHLLEHLYDPASFLNAARDLLKPEGRLVRSE